MEDGNQIRYPFKVIAQEMTNQGWVDEKLAAKAGLSSNSVSDIRRGKAANPTLGTLGAVADALDLVMVVAFRPKRAKAS